MKGLVIYGDPYTGKSTLDLNLRLYYFDQFLTQDPIQFDGVRCFLGKTAKRGNQLMSCGGAESLKESPELPLGIDWLIAAIPTKGMFGVKIATDLMRMREVEAHAICLYTDRQADYRNKRVSTFSQRFSYVTGSTSKVRYPVYIPTDRCYVFRTEELLEALNFAIDLMGRIDDKEVSSFLTLEDFLERSNGSHSLEG